MFLKNSIIYDSLFILELQYISNIILFLNLNYKKENNNILYLFFYIYYLNNLHKIKYLKNL